MDGELLEQLDAVESNYLLKRKKLSPERLENIENATTAGQSSSSTPAKSLLSNENQEKQKRSLLDCLDQSYYNEMPSKIKRESKSPNAKTIFNKQNVSLSKTEQLRNGDSVEVVNIDDSKTVDGSTENEVNSNLIKEMDNELESLHVVSEPNSEENFTESEVVPDTPPSTKLYVDKPQKTLFDYFGKS